MNASTPERASCDQHGDFYSGFAKCPMCAAEDEPVRVEEPAGEPKPCPHPNKCTTEGCHGCDEPLTRRVAQSANADVLDPAREAIHYALAQLDGSRPDLYAIYAEGLAALALPVPVGDGEASASGRVVREALETLASEANAGDTSDSAQGIDANNEILREGLDALDRLMRPERALSPPVGDETEALPQTVDLVVAVQNGLNYGGDYMPDTLTRGAAISAVEQLAARVAGLEAREASLREVAPQAAQLRRACLALRAKLIPGAPEKYSGTAVTVSLLALEAVLAALPDVGTPVEGVQGFREHLRKSAALADSGEAGS